MLSISTNFSNDTQGNDLNVIPLVRIQKAGIDLSVSTNNITFDGIYYKPLLLNIPSIKESVDFESRRYKISNLSLQLSNSIYEGERLSDIGDLINSEVTIYWKSQNCTTLTGNETGCLLAYKGMVRNIDISDRSVNLNVEDTTQENLHRDLPVARLGSGDDVLEKDKTTPIPMVYGHVDRSPCKVKSVTLYDDQEISSEDINIILDDDDTVTVNGDSPLIVKKDDYINIPAEIETILGYTGGVQYEIINNLIILKPSSLDGTDTEELDDQISSNAIADNKIIGFESVAPSAIKPLQILSSMGTGYLPLRYASVPILGEVYTNGDTGIGRIYGTLFHENEQNDWQGTSATGENDIWWDYNDTQYEESLVGCTMSMPIIGESNYIDHIGKIYSHFKSSFYEKQSWLHSHVNIRIRFGGSLYGDNNYNIVFNNQQAAGTYEEPNFIPDAQPTHNSISGSDIPVIIERVDKLLFYMQIDYGRSIMVAQTEFLDLYVDHYMLLDNMLKSDFYVNALGRRGAEYTNQPMGTRASERNWQDLLNFDNFEAQTTLGGDTGSIGNAFVNIRFINHQYPENNWNGSSYLEISNNYQDTPPYSLGYYRDTQNYEQAGVIVMEFANNYVTDIITDQSNTYDNTYFKAAFRFINYDTPNASRFSEVFVVFYNNEEATLNESIVTNDDLYEDGFGSTAFTEGSKYQYYYITSPNGVTGTYTSNNNVHYPGGDIANAPTYFNRIAWIIRSGNGSRPDNVSFYIDSIEAINCTVTEYDSDVPGCTDPLAENYNPDATIDDGSCTYPNESPTLNLAYQYIPDFRDAQVDFFYNWQDDDFLPVDFSIAFRYLGEYNAIFIDTYGSSDPDGTIDSWSLEVEEVSRDITVNEVVLINGEAIYPDGEPRTGFFIRIPDLSTVPVDESITFTGTITATDNSLDSSSETFEFSVLGTQPPPVEGCTDPDAINYDPTATVDDGSCEYPITGCTDPGAINYNPDAEVDDGSCILPLYGCMDSAAINYNPAANMPCNGDNSCCEYAPDADPDTDTLIKNPADIIHHIVKEEVGSTATVNDLDKLNAHNNHKFYDFYGLDETEGMNWRFGFTQHKKINSKKLIEDIAKSSRLFPKFKNNGEFGFNSIRDFYIDLIGSEIKTKDVIDFKFTQTPLSEVYSRVKVLYKKDYADDDLKKDTGWMQFYDMDQYIGEESDFYNYYNMDAQTVDSDGNYSGGQELIFESEYIRDENTAKALRHFLLGWYMNQHNQVSAKLPLSYLGYEIGDVIYFDELLGGIKINGEDYTRKHVLNGDYYIDRNGQVIYPMWMITETSKNIDSVNIKAIQLHDWTGSVNYFRGDTLPTAFANFTIQKPAIAHGGVEGGNYDFSIGTTVTPEVGKLGITEYLFTNSTAEGSVTSTSWSFTTMDGVDITDFEIIEGGLSENVVKIKFNSAGELIQEAGNYHHKIRATMTTSVDVGGDSDVSDSREKILRLYVNGDITRDSTLNILDMVLLVEMILATEETRPIDDHYIGDFTEDGVLNIFDVVLLIDGILEV